MSEPEVPCQCAMCVRRRAATSRTHIPYKAQSNPDARAWHWNEHPEGKFPPQPEPKKLK